MAWDQEQNRTVIDTRQVKKLWEQEGKEKNEFSLGATVEQKTKGHLSLLDKTKKGHFEQELLTQKCAQLAEEGSPNVVTLSITFCLRAEKYTLCPIKDLN